MPTIDPTRLESTATRIFQGLGAPPGDAVWIARLLVLANLRGHDSHGVIRIPQYALAVKTGGMDPTSPVTVVAETPVTARLDGGRGFGQVVARRRMELAIAKAKAAGLSAVGLSRTTHVGRLADYAEMAAAQGLVGMLWVNAVHGLNVAPWGGAARRLGTNPHAIGIPGAGGPAMVLDFATSVVAEGKMRVKKNRKQQAPPGWFIDAEGRSATDPEIFYGDPVGSLLTPSEAFLTDLRDLVTRRSKFQYRGSSGGRESSSGPMAVSSTPRLRGRSAGPRSYASGASRPAGRVPRAGPTRRAGAS